MIYRRDHHEPWLDSRNAARGSRARCGGGHCPPPRRDFGVVAERRAPKASGSSLYAAGCWRGTCPGWLYEHFPGGKAKIQNAVRGSRQALLHRNILFMRVSEAQVMSGEGLYRARSCIVVILKGDPASYLPVICFTGEERPVEPIVSASLWLV